MDRKDRIKYMFIGHAIGDALGLPYEFSNNYIYNGLIKDTHIVKRQGRSFGIGQVSDDNEMALVLARTLISGYNSMSIVAKYQEWAASGQPCLGKNTRFLLKSKSYAGYLKKWSSLEASNQSNGSLMRCFPIACLTDYVGAAQFDCSVTNPSLVNQQCSLIYITVLRFALDGHDITLIKKSLETYMCNFETIKIAINEGLTGTHRDIKTNRGWVVHAMYALSRTIVMLSLNKTYDDVMDWVMSNKGCDTDTLAAIVGAFIGAYKGKEIIDSPKGRHNYNMIMSNYATDYPRQDIYRMFDLDDIVDKLTL
jgi:ADP-ribosylglycohydrolase